MSFGKTRTPKLPKQEPIEDVQQVKQDSIVAGQQEKRKQILRGGRQSTILSGIQNALKQRLGQ